MFAPTSGTVTISGVVTDENGGPLAGVRLRLLSVVSASTVTDDDGYYRFDNVDVGSFCTLKPEFANYNFSPASLSFSLVGNKSDATFTASPNPNGPIKVIGSNDFFPRQQYRDFLNREPDQHGLLYGSDRLNQCNGDAVCLRRNRINVSAAFFSLWS
jgi:hypothetical protein